jgi:hypothetical protein
MDIDASVLRAILRLSRRREAADEEALLLRAGGNPGQVRAAVRRLATAGLVDDRAGRPPRLTMEGLAVAVALLPGSVQSVRRAPRATRAA